MANITEVPTGMSLEKSEREMTDESFVSDVTGSEVPGLMISQGTHRRLRGVEGGGGVFDLRH